MKREWKPGDVAIVEAGCWANRKVALRLAEGWAHVNGISPDHDGIVTPVRPLVVIDPEDREQVERLAGGQGRVDVDWLQERLREFADPKPPKPEEPTGLGAVVEDANGAKHIRTYFGGVRHAWLGYIADDGGERTRYWDDIDAVRVLSDGLTS